MRHCADDDDYDGRRMELEGGREREIAEREGQGKAGSGGRSGGEGDCFCRLLFSRVGAGGGREAQKGK